MIGSLKSSGCNTRAGPGRTKPSPAQAAESAETKEGGGLLHLFIPCANETALLKVRKFVYASALSRAYASSFNPRPSCEGRPEATEARIAKLRVSIRAPRVRGDHMSKQARALMAVFQSAPLV